MGLKPGKKWDVSKCSETFKTDDTLTRHMAKHNPGAKVKCEVRVLICKIQYVTKV